MVQNVRNHVFLVIDSPSSPFLLAVEFFLCVARKKQNTQMKWMFIDKNCLLANTIVSRHL